MAVEKSDMLLNQHKKQKLDQIFLWEYSPKSFRIFVSAIVIQPVQEQSMIRITSYSLLHLSEHTKKSWE